MLSTFDLLHVLSIKGIGDKSAIQFRQFCIENSISKVSSREIIEIIDELRKTNKRIKKPNITDIEKAKDIAGHIFRESEVNQIEIVQFGSSDYPILLHHMDDPPLIVHVKGNIESFDLRPTLTVVGTREPSNYGAKLGRKFCELVIEKANFHLVSGLALGCDTIAHEASVKYRKPTIAVLAGGLHSIYPKENRVLAEQILENNGVLISELPFGINPMKSTFVKRDRIQSALSYGTVIIQTGIKGGTMHTAMFTTKQKRILACLLPSDSEKYLSDDKYQGNLKLIKNGAVEITTPEAIDNLISNVIELYDKTNNNIKQYFNSEKNKQLTIFDD